MLTPSQIFLLVILLIWVFLRRIFKTKFIIIRMFFAQNQLNIKMIQGQFSYGGVGCFSIATQIFHTLWHLFGIFLPKHFQRMGCPKICLLEATGQEDDHRGHQRHHLHHWQRHCRHQLREHCVEDHLWTSVKEWAIHVSEGHI